MNCPKCPGQPKLVQYKFSESATADYPATDLELCNGCGRKVDQRLCETFWYCVGCHKWKYCEFCRYCPKLHCLRKVVMLGNINPIYTNNSFNCNICKKNAKTTDDGIWHCSTCQYDVCPTCLE